MVKEENLNSDKIDEYTYVARILLKYFDKLPSNTTNKLLLKLAEKDEVAYYVAKIIAKKFNKLPTELRDELLLKLSDKNQAIESVASTIEGKFDKIPESIRNELLLKLSCKDSATKSIVNIVAKKFDKLPEDIRSLLFHYSDKDESAYYVAQALANNFAKIPEDVRNELLLNLSSKDTTIEYVASIVAKNFNKLPDNIKSLLFDLSNKDQNAIHVFQAVINNFDKIPTNTRNRLLLKLSENDITARNIALAVNLDEIPKNIKHELLSKLRLDKVEDFKLCSEKIEPERVGHIKSRSSGKDYKVIFDNNGVVYVRSVGGAWKHCGSSEEAIEVATEMAINSIGVIEIDDKLKKKKRLSPSLELEKTEISSISKFVDVNFPDHVNLHKKCPLTIRLISEKIDRITEDIVLIFGYAEGIEEIEVLVTLYAKDFEIEESEKKMIVPLIKNSEPVVFYLTPKSVGEKEIRLKFYQNQNYNGEISIKTTVYHEEIKEEISKVVPNGEVGVYTNKGKNQDLLIEVEINDDYLEYYVTSEILDVYKKRYRAENRLHEPKQYMNDLLKELSSISSVSHTDEEKYKHIIKNVEIIGKNLYKRLIPENLKTVLWNNKDRINSIFIVTDQEGEGAWIPWEIMKPFTITEDNKMKTDDFLGIKYVISRWLSGHFPPNYITIRNSAVIVNNYNGKLQNVTKEKTNIENIFQSKNLGIISIVPKKYEILDALSDDENTIDLLHFAVDSNYDESSPDDSYIRLDESEKLTPRDIGVNGLNGKPLIFMNACQSGRMNYSFSGAGGFTKAFLDTGASVFVGTIWKVPDELSKEFSEEFYRNVFENGISLGEALRDTKRKLSTSKNPAWLSYTLYCSPLAKTNFTKEVPL